MKATFKMICLLVSVLLLTGCGTTASDPAQGHDATPESGTYSVLLFGLSDSIPGTSHEVEYTYWSTPVETDDAPETMSMTIKGDRRSGELYAANISSPNNYVEYCYYDADKGSFGMNEFGELTFCFWEQQDDPAGSLEELSQDACLQIAKEFLSDFVDVDGYQLEVEHLEESEEYLFHFTKYIGGYKTADTATVGVFENGGLDHFRSYMFDKIPASTSVDFDYSKATEAVYEKLDLLYADVKDRYEKIEYELYPFVVTLLEDGEAALVCTVDVTCVEPLEEGFKMYHDDKIELIIKAG